MPSYQDIYPSEALLRSFDVVRPRAGDLLNLEYFEAEPADMPTLVFDQHHILLNLNPQPHDVENWRDGAHRKFTFRQNEVVITPAGMESGWRWHARSKVIVVTILPDRLARFAESELAIILTEKQLRDVPQVEDADLVQAAEMVLTGLRAGGAGSNVMFDALARVFLVKLIERYGEERTEALAFTASFTAQHYKRVLDHVARHFGSQLTIEDMAREAGLSTAHFSRLFRQVIGETPYQYLMDYRVEQAKKMLGEAGRPLIDIALACGFSDQPHFTRVFKRLTGKTPKEWRAIS
ncbi:MAG: helix-turn-helix transcriptional regulator [Sphingomonadaceae bacterium]|nr:helix-turn-helix transcriptional regulator [Sphingomonadaceae bacterium]